MVLNHHLIVINVGLLTTQKQTYECGCLALMKNHIFVYSEEKCTTAPKECGDIIPYTSETNKLFELETEADYMNFSNAIMNSLEECNMDSYIARWGVCNMMFPRCLLGWELQFCKWTCLGMNVLPLYTILYFF